MSCEKTGAEKVEEGTLTGKIYTCFYVVLDNIPGIIVSSGKKIPEYQVTDRTLGIV